LENIAYFARQKLVENRRRTQVRLGFPTNF